MPLSPLRLALPNNDQARKIIELRELIAQRFPVVGIASVRSRLPTGIGVLDECLEGGLSKGAITEVVCPTESTGSATIIQSLIEFFRASKRHLALVDFCDSFDPDGLSNSDLAALLWVQCIGPDQALKAADVLLRDGNLPLVILDMMMCSAREVRAIPSTYWYRLQRVTEGNGSAALIFTPVPVVGSALCTLRLNQQFDLVALDSLRSQVAADLRIGTMRARTDSRSFTPFAITQANVG